jgi:hypothetical protein
MKKKICFHFTTLIIFFQLNAQVNIVDKETNDVIPFVEIYDTSGNIIGLSDENGTITKEIIEKINQLNTSSIQFSHISYKTSLIPKSKFLELKQIYLTREIIMLDEAVVVPNKNRNFLLLKGYYRTYNIIDTQVKSYSDGIIEYLYPTDSKKSVVIRRLQERSFLKKTPAILSDTVKKLMEINIVGPRIPDMNIIAENTNHIYDYLDEQSNHYFLLSREKQSKITKIDIEKGNKAILQEVSYLSPNEQKVIKRFGNESSFEYHNESSLYHTDSLADISLSNLIYHKEIRKFKMKGKNDERFQNVEDVGEFFIESVEYLDKQPKGFGKFTGFNKFSSYSLSFWEQFTKHPFYKPLPSGILESLKENLIEFKNIHR